MSLSIGYNLFIPATLLPNISPWGCIAKLCFGYCSVQYILNRTPDTTYGRLADMRVDHRRLWTTVP